MISSKVDIEGNTLLHMAVKQSRIQMIQYLADKAVNPSALNNTGLGAIHLAAKQDKTDVLLTLLDAFKHRINVNERTADNETILHIATKQGNLDLIHTIVTREKGWILLELLSLKQLLCINIMSKRILC